MRDSGTPDISLRRKPYYVLLASLVLILSGIVWYVDPQVLAHLGGKESYLPLLLISGTTLTLAAIIIRNRFRLGLGWGVMLTIFMWLRIWGMGNYINFLLLIGLMGSFEAYFKYADKPPMSA